MNSKKETSYAAEFAREWEQIRAAAAQKQNKPANIDASRVVKINKRPRGKRVSSSAVLF